MEKTPDRQLKARMSMKLQNMIRQSLQPVAYGDINYTVKQDGSRPIADAHEQLLQMGLASETGTLLMILKIYFSLCIKNIPTHNICYIILSYNDISTGKQKQCCNADDHTIVSYAYLGQEGSMKTPVGKLADGGEILGTAQV